MSQWPEPTPDPTTEPPRWWSAGTVLGLLAAGLVFWAVASFDDASWRLPEFELPDFEAPEISTLDLRGRESAGGTTGPGIAYNPMADIPADGAPLVRPASFEDCLRTIDGAAQAFGPPALIEDTPARHVARFKLADAQITVTCADGAMTIEQGQ